MKSFKTNLFLKISLIVVIALLLFIPTSMIKDLIRERENTQRNAIQEVSSKWGEVQTVSGPYVSVPYYKNVKQYSTKDSAYKLIKVKEYIHFLPTLLNVNGEIFPERRYRGIYEIVVYNSKLNISGEYNDIDFLDLDIPLEDIQFEKAFITVGISDLRGIEKQVELNWNQDKSSFNPGTITHDILESGINAPIRIAKNDSSNYKFSLDFDLKGSQMLYFIPVGEVTDVNIASSWANPSFNGAFLPDNRTVSDSGFTANWNILHLNRNFPQQWIGSLQRIDYSAFGIDLLLPVDSYLKSMRSIKYAILFIGFTFLVFFFVEVLNKVFIHPVQYVLVGIALVVFYTLLLSISEHLTYNLAFLVSAVATLLLIIGYVKAILKSNMLTFLIGGILSVLYTFIFVIIQLQDYALLIGSIGIFIILSLVMYFSRKIDWYNLKME
ncbi:MAG: cell envelope integrity protein CreD [Bacteroidetes bacterium]|nr:cell envelope integrity protein CreD [Bacteroidota bacterium]MBT5528836.1 cell envelope integrity protein CreD [Cytophagia bacterium]MBT4338428.1 cell envelope integrity protein CreD [Bacteroidota bacterium]MBT4727605.1 cell envelope integrity protein CreD [Bacteroidota bacterium]MBT6838137.1 cell envelope integrity protein CreD [Bacteroidota bacterium]